MERNSRSVKTPRRYDSSRRQQQALHTRADVLAAAQRLVLTNGYAETTIASIAAAADVSVETIYKSFGGKPGLVRAIAEQGLAGGGPIHAEHRSDQMRLRESDPRQIIRNWGVFVTELAPRTAPIMLLMRRAAASDADVASQYEQLVSERLHRMETNARHLYERRYLRPSVSLEEARDVLWLYSSLDLYELLVLRRGWSVERYGEFVANAMIAALLPG
jgi:AcrR family transcriptional regulator